MFSCLIHTSAKFLAILCLLETVISTSFRPHIHHTTPWINHKTPDERSSRLDHVLVQLNKEDSIHLKVNPVYRSLIFGYTLRGGATQEHVDNIASTEEENDEVDSLSEKVNAAMQRLGIVPPTQTQDEESFDTISASRKLSSSSSPPTQEHYVSDTTRVETECKDGICPLPSSPLTLSTSSSSSPPSLPTVHAYSDPYKDQSMDEMVKSIAQELDVDKSIVMAAIGATMKVNDNNLNQMDLDAAKQMIVLEKNAIASIPEDSVEVQQLLSEGYDLTLSRRALAFTGNNVDNARAVLIADQEDEKEEEIRLAREEEQAIRQQEASMKSIRVDANFDPTQISSTEEKDTSTIGKAKSPPLKTVKREEVIFHANASTIESLILDSPVPVLLDVYADWCGPCKTLTPILEEITMKAGGLFRLVKLNTDQERTVSQALEVTALPTLFSIRDGQIQTSFQGVPPNEDFMKKFMMGLLGAGPIYPTPSSEEKLKLVNLTTKLMKIAGAATFSFSQREILQRKIDERLDDMANGTDKGGDLIDVEEAMRTLRSLLSNIIQFPYDLKYRRIHLENKVIAAKLGNLPSAIAILRSIGFHKETSAKHLILGNGKRYVNLTALIIARDSIDKWIDRHRRDIAAAERKRVDEAFRLKLAEEEDTLNLEHKSNDTSNIQQQSKDTSITHIQIRIEGKKKMYAIQAPIEDPLSSILHLSPLNEIDTANITITCAGKKLTVKSDDVSTMGKSFRHLNLYPNVILVIKLGNKERHSTTSKLKERAELRKNLKRGEHTMQSIGVYAKDDGAKGELIDGGGGVWYEHDVSDDEDGQNDK